MISRSLQNRIEKVLATVPVVAILGPRQVGKTTLAHQIINSFLDKESFYLDLERESDLVKLDEAEDYLTGFKNKLLIIDEVQRKPDLFVTLRSLIDERRRSSEKGGHFILLGSASRDLIQHSTETLAGRIHFFELSPFSVAEINRSDSQQSEIKELWKRGGFPASFLAQTEEESWDWRTNFIASYVERDIPVMGPNISSTRMRRVWNMLAHLNGQQVNLSNLGKSLEVDHKTIRAYMDLLSDFYMVRYLPPWSGNSKKRLVKSPKVYLRDSGILHRLLNIPDMETLLGHPGIGTSWEGFVVENIITNLPDTWQFSYYRNSAGAEIDLVMEGPGRSVIAIEVKRSSSPRVSAQFHTACEDIKATRKIVIYSGNDSFAMSNNTEAIGLTPFLFEFSQLTSASAKK